MLIDVFGWFSTSSYATRGARLIPVGPGRIYDSRNPSFGVPDPVTALEVVTVPIRGADSLNPAVTDIVPNSPSVVGALVNVTGVNNRAGSQPTFVSVVPETPVGGQWPTTSNLNLRAGQIKPNLVLVPVGADGAIRLFNESGSVDLVVDIVGYLVNGAASQPRPGASCRSRRRSACSTPVSRRSARPRSRPGRPRTGASRSSSTTSASAAFRSASSRR